MKKRLISQADLIGLVSWKDVSPSSKSSSSLRLRNFNHMISRRSKGRSNSIFNFNRFLLQLIWGQAKQNQQNFGFIAFQWHCPGSCFHSQVQVIETSFCTTSKRKTKIVSTELQYDCIDRSAKARGWHCELVAQGCPHRETITTTHSCVLAFEKCANNFPCFYFPTVWGLWSGVFLLRFYYSLLRF